MIKYSFLIFLSLYFLFTSGLVFELTKSEAIDNLDIPFSFGYSGERTGIVGIFSDDDIEVAEWLVSKSNMSLMIVTDTNGRGLLYEYVPIVPRVRPELTGRQPVLSTLDKFGSRFYYFQSGWMTKNSKYIEWSMNGIGLRKAHPLPSFEGYTLTRVYSKGDSYVYEVTK